MKLTTASNTVGWVAALAGAWQLWVGHLDKVAELERSMACQQSVHAIVEAFVEYHAEAQLE